MLRQGESREEEPPSLSPLIDLRYSGQEAGAGAGGTQGLAHWMSVMAEHMNPESSLHHPYMWTNGIDQKMSLSEQQQLLQKGYYLYQ